MTQPVSVINVYYKGFGTKRRIGQLTMDGRRPVFGYDAAWIADGLELSPIEMPLRSAPYYGNHASSHKKLLGNSSAIVSQHLSKCGY